MHCSTGLLLGARPLDNRKPSGDFYPVFRRLATFSLYLEKVTHSGFRKKLLLMDLKSLKTQFGKDSISYWNWIFWSGKVDFFHLHIFWRAWHLTNWLNILQFDRVGKTLAEEKLAPKKVDLKVHNCIFIMISTKNLLSSMQIIKMFS